MKFLKAVPVIVMLVGGTFASLNAAVDDPTFTVTDDPASAKKPFEGDLNTGYLVQSGNTKSSSLTADTTMTWHGQITTWSLWRNVGNIPSNGERSSEKYAADGRSRFNLTDYDYLFGQVSWLTDHCDGYRERDVLIVGYGRQFLNGPIHNFRSEFGPGMRYSRYTNNTSEAQSLGYTSGIYTRRLTDNAKFTQGALVFGVEDTTLNSESVLNATISEHLGSRVAYNVTWNSKPLESAPEHTDRRTTLLLGYSM